MNAASPMDVVVVTGISGSGKSVAMHALEDAGYFCVDNLPPELLDQFLSLVRLRGERQVAVATDVRSTGSPYVLVDLLQSLHQQGQPVRTLFLEANNETLVRRFSESRRPHPLSGHPGAADGPVAEHRLDLQDAIALERRLMEDVRERATVLDTSPLKPAQLRQWVRDLLHIPHGRLTLVFESFAYKQGVPLDADFVFDVRVLPNPHYVRELRPLTGRDAGVIDYLQQQPEAHDMVEHISAFLARWLRGFDHDQRSYLTVAIGCTGGQHRSVYIAERLGARFAGQRPTLVRHRELDARA